MAAHTVPINQRLHNLTDCEALLSYPVGTTTIYVRATLSTMRTGIVVPTGRHRPEYYKCLALRFSASRQRRFFFA